MEYSCELYKKRKITENKMESKWGKSNAYKFLMKNLKSLVHIDNATCEHF
jgi:hypothetical protein